MYYLNGQNIGPVINFNVAKCKVVHIGSVPYVGNCYLNVTQLEILENIRDLVISKFKFHAHTKTAAEKTNDVFGYISKSFECKDPDVIIQLLYAPSLNIIMFYGDQLTYLVIKSNVKQTE